MIHTKLIAAALLAIILTTGGYVLYLQQKKYNEFQSQRLEILNSYASHLSQDLDQVHRQGTELTDFLDHIEGDLPKEGMLAVRDQATGMPVLVAIGDRFTPAHSGNADWLSLLPPLANTQNHGVTEIQGIRLLWYNSKIHDSPWIISLFLVEDDGAMGYADTLFWMLLAIGIATMAVTGYKFTARVVAKLRGEIPDALHDAGMRDRLTDLPNRALFTEVLDREISDAMKSKKPFALCLIGINHFKRFNNALGNAGGDELLREFARRIRRVLRSDDIAARCGGDEFGIILRNVDHTGALAAIQKIMSAEDDNFVIGENTYLVTARAGVALFSDHHADGQTLLRQADAAMRAAKNEGARILVYQTMYEDQISDVVVLSADLRAAISHNQIELHYQPKYNLATNRVCGAEALLRWKHPTRGAIPPLDFIAVAEQSGLIKQLTYWVIDRAFQDYPHMARLVPNFKLAINLSVANLHDPRLVEEISGLIAKNHASPTNFVFEITESAVMVNIAQIVASLRALHFSGFGISVDDFGTGYTSFLNLKHLPINEIKIDRSFVRNLMTEHEDESIVQATIDLGRALGIAVVAEGVEDAKTLEKLRDSGCHFVQGYFIGKPVPLSELTQSLQQYHGPIDEYPPSQRMNSARKKKV